MDTANLSATSALIGSLTVGAFEPRRLLAHPARAGAGATASPRGGEARALYAEFIIEASRRLNDAWGHQAESPEVVAGLYSVIRRRDAQFNDTRGGNNGNRAAR